LVLVTIFINNYLKNMEIPLEGFIDQQCDEYNSRTLQNQFLNMIDI